VPAPNVSVVDLTFVSVDPITGSSINAAIKKASEVELKGTSVTTKQSWFPATSKGNPHSSIFDSKLTKVIGDNTGKVTSWYDNRTSSSSTEASVAANRRVKRAISMWVVSSEETPQQRNGAGSTRIDN
jgi:glyceraldehyde-3-phosphate dehydrogenase/erythrose-4-phosphate dehydrogenase